MAPKAPKAPNAPKAPGTTKTADAPPRAAASVGYSGTPLAKKLGLKEGTVLVARRAPAGYAGWLAPLPAGARIATRAGTTGATGATGARAVHLFVTRRAELAVELADWRRRLDPEGFLWVSWPKKSAKVPTDVTEDVVREVALPLGFVDVKVCAVTEVWSGLKLVVRKALRR